MESQTQPFNTPKILDAQGKPARKLEDSVCARCGAGPEKRVKSSGFGIPHPVCVCGMEFFGETCK